MIFKNFLTFEILPKIRQSSVRILDLNPFIKEQRYIKRSTTTNPKWDIQSKKNRKYHQNRKQRQPTKQLCRGII